MKFKKILLLERGSNLRLLELIYQEECYSYHHANNYVIPFGVFQSYYKQRGNKEYRVQGKKMPRLAGYEVRQIGINSRWRYFQNLATGWQLGLLLQMTCNLGYFFDWLTMWITSSIGSQCGWLLQLTCNMGYFFDWLATWVTSSAVLKEFFEGILYHHKRNHKQLSRGVTVWGRSSWKICLAFKVP